MENEYLIQIIGYRKVYDKQTGKEFMWQKHFDHIKITSIVKLFENLDTIINAIPENERYNLHFTNANCHTPSKDKSVPLRLFKFQEMIPIDLDDIDLDRKDEYIKLVVDELKIDASKTGINISGHGLHFVVALSQPIETGEELHRLQKYYKALCVRLNIAFFESGLSGNADPIRLAEAATLRLPNTINRKDGKEDARAYVIQGKVEPQAFYLDKIIDIVEEEAIVKTARVVDAKGVLTGCEFLKYAYANPQLLSEPQWYAMIGTLSFIPEVGINLCHTYSEAHTDYSFEATQTKAEQALGFGKPRTCENINQVYPGCGQCPHFNKIKTPLSIRSDEFIGTQSSGFHTVIQGKDGAPDKTIPNYGDLLKYFAKVNIFVVDRQSRQVSVFNGTHWASYTEIEIDGFATKHFDPVATNSKRSEFKGLLLSTNLVDNSFFGKDNSGYVNFKNGVLRLLDRALLPHSPEFGFNYVLPYDYNPHAVCPEFNKMMDNVTLHDNEIQDLLLEFIGYSISGLRASFGAKALILTGGGSNGKSTFLNVLKMMIGEPCFSTVSLEDMSNSNARFSMVGKLFNICEEVEEDELKKGTAIFKSIVTGANLMVKKLYSDTVSMRLDTKLILSCNELPSSRENTYAIYRRMLIVPFRAQFDRSTGVDKHIEDRISKEMSGVYNRVLEAYDRFIKNDGVFSDSLAAEKALAEYKYNNSTYNQFADQCLEITRKEADWISSDELMTAYKSWADINNIMFKPTQNNLVKELKTMGVLLGSAEVKRVGKMVKRVFRGVKNINGGLCESNLAD